MVVKTANGPIIVGVCAHKNNGALSPIMRHITDTLNARPGVKAAPVHELAGEKEYNCLSAVRQGLRKKKVDAIISLETGKELRVFHNGNRESAFFAAGNMVVAFNGAGYTLSLPKDFAINKKGQTLSALSAEIDKVFSDYGLPSYGISNLKSAIMHFRNSCDQLSLEKRFEMALNAIFTTPQGFNTGEFVKVMGKLHEIFAKYDYPMLFVKGKNRGLVPALHIELPGDVVAKLGEKIAGVVDRGVERLLQAARG